MVLIKTMVTKVVVVITKVAVTKEVGVIKEEVDTMAVVEGNIKETLERVTKEIVITKEMDIKAVEEGMEMSMIIEIAVGDTMVDIKIDIGECKELGGRKNIRNMLICNLLPSIILQCQL